MNSMLMVAVYSCEALLVLAVAADLETGDTHGQGIVSLSVIHPLRQVPGVDVVP